MTAPITLLLFVPLGCAVLSLLLSFRWGRSLAMFGMLAQCLLAALLLREVLIGGPLLYPLANWMPPLGIALRIDALAVVMLCLTALIAAACGMHAGLYLNPHRRWQRHFWPLYWFLWAGLNGVWLADDLFNLYVGLELVTLCAVGLVALDGRGQTTSAALRYVFAALLGSMFYLLGVALLYAEYGLLSLQLLDGQMIGRSHGSALAVLLMLLGLAVKTALWPVHGWLPPAHAGAKTPVSALLSALVVKASFYIAWRLWMTLPVHFTAYQWLAQLLGLLGSVAVFYGGYRALKAVRLKQLVAYSSVSQIGYLFLLFPLCSSLSADVARLVQQGILLHLVSHALAKAAMFLAAGNLVLALGSSRVVALAGVSHHLPLSLFGLGLAGVSLMGLPPSGGFVGKWLLLQAVFATAQWWWLVTLLLGGLLTAGYIFRLYLASFVEHGTGRRFNPPHLSLEVLPLLLAIAAITLGFLADPLLRAAGLVSVEIRT